MNFDFEKVFQDMLSAGKGALQAGGEEAQAYFDKVMQQQKSTVAQLSTKRVHGKLSNADFMDELDAIRGDVVAELKGLEVIAEEAAEDAWNAARHVLTNAIAAIL